MTSQNKEVTNPKQTIFIPPKFDGNPNFEKKTPGPGAHAEEQ